MFSQQIAERLEELAPWEAEKEVERQQRLAHMRRYYSVRKLQRWWRAYMASNFIFFKIKKIRMQFKSVKQQFNLLHLFIIFR